LAFGLSDFAGGLNWGCSRMFRGEKKMRMFWTAFAGLAIAATLSGCTEQKTGLAAVSDAMGATNLNSIEYSGSWRFVRLRPGLHSRGALAAFHPAELYGERQLPDARDAFEHGA
jgi:hypothetical protein